MTDLVGGVEPERQECCHCGHEVFGSFNCRSYGCLCVTHELLAGFGERLAQAIEGLRCPCGAVVGDHGHVANHRALDSAAALVREQFTQLAGHDRNKT